MLATSQRRTSRTRAAAPKTEEGKETAKQVDAKLEEVFDKIEGAEDDIAAGNLEQKTAMEERQKDPRYADAKDALDLNKKDLEPTSGKEQGAQGDIVQRLHQHASARKAVGLHVSIICIHVY